VRNRIETRARQEMLEVEEDLMTTYPDLDLNTVLYGGRPETELKFEMKKNAYDLLVMGLRGAGNTRRALIGSVTAEVLESSRTPVLCVPPDMGEFSLHHVAFATNLEPADLKVYTQMQSLFGDLLGEVKWIHVQPQTPDYSEAQFKTETEMSALGMPPLRIESASLSEGIDQYLKDSNANLLVMTHERRGVIRRLFDEGLTRQIYFESRIPLLVFTR
jgi:nucleotide-binding universal stress UspA family protein